MTYASGWENPDGHEPLEARKRPMFDASGQPVTQAPPPDPAPELDMLRPGDGPASVPLVVADWDRENRADDDPEFRGREVQIELPRMRDHGARLAEIRQVAQDAADTDSRVAWLAALSKIIELAR
jgi:hypothetical protein